MIKISRTTENYKNQPKQDIPTMTKTAQKGSNQTRTNQINMAQDNSNLSYSDLKGEGE